VISRVRLCGGFPTTYVWAEQRLLKPKALVEMLS